MTKIKIAALQTKVHVDKMENLRQLEELLALEQLQGVDLVTLGEMFNCPYQTSNFPIYAEEEGGTCWSLCSQLAAKHHIYLSAGSMPERDGKGHIYNTAYVFDREGRQIAKHRKCICLILMLVVVSVLKNPIRFPQEIRWWYLTRNLARWGFACVMISVFQSCLV